MQNNESLLHQLTTDLTSLAKDGKLDPVIERDNEIEQIIMALCNDPPQNPLLIGESGIGKTTIVEGLAQRIAKGQVPDKIAQKRILQPDVGSLVGGAGWRTCKPIN